MGLLAYMRLSGELLLEPRPVVLSAGSSSNDLRLIAKFTVMEDLRDQG